MLDKNTVGRKLIKLRGGKPQSLVANDLNISTSALGMYEQGRRTPRDEIKLGLARYYNTTVGSLFFGDWVHV